MSREDEVTRRPDESLFGDSFGLVAAAHELKSPLALIRQLTYQLEDISLTDGERQRLLQQSRHTAERALRLTSDLTRASRLESGLFELEPVNATAVCEDVVAELYDYFKAHGKQLKMTRRRRTPLLAIADQQLLRRIIANFSDNALHYAGISDRVDLSVTTSRDGRVRVAVRDYGPAMSRTDFSLLKERLSRPQPLQSRPQSSGLGLVIAGQFASAMNSQIGIICHRDGASFYVDMKASTQLSLL